MTPDYLPLLAAISAALIAGYFSFVTLINSKEQKTSEFRQNWIDSLRKEISEFTASVYFLKFYYQQGAKNTDPDFINGLKEIHNKYVSSSTAILLRINANETNKYLKAVNDAFLSALSGVLDSVNASRYDEATTRCNALVDKAKPLLKEEWKRVKAGERSYKVIKYFSISLFAGAFMYAWSISPFQARDGAKAQSTAVVGGGATEKAASSQNCTLSVSVEQSRPVKVKAASGKTSPCSDTSEK
jgi:hypothetical protein